MLMYDRQLRTFSEEDMPDDVRDILLQDSMSGGSSSDIISEALESLCTTIIYGNPTDTWQFNVYDVLRSLAATSAGLDALETLQERGKTVFDLCQKIIEK